MTLVTEVLLLWALILHLGLPIIGQVICVVLFLIGRAGLINIGLGGDRVLKL